MANVRRSVLNTPLYQSAGAIRAALTCMLAGLTLLLAACSGGLWFNRGTPTPNAPFAVEDAGEVCFYTYDAAAGTLTGKFWPLGCYSSSCTRIIEQSVTAAVDESARTLDLQSRFVLLDTTVRFPEAQECTADCGGGGEVPVVFEGLTGQTYTVILGTTRLGELTLAQVGDLSQQSVCLGERD